MQEIIYQFIACYAGALFLQSVSKCCSFNISHCEFLSVYTCCAGFEWIWQGHVCFLLRLSTIVVNSLLNDKFFRICILLMQKFY